MFFRGFPLAYTKESFSWMVCLFVYQKMDQIVSKVDQENRASLSHKIIVNGGTGINGAIVSVIDLLKTQKQKSDPMKGGIVQGLRSIISTCGLRALGRIIAVKMIRDGIYCSITFTGMELWAADFPLF